MLAGGRLKTQPTGYVRITSNEVDKLAEYRLPGLPVFDGMAAANGKLYLATTDGKVVCFVGK